MAFQLTPEKVLLLKRLVSQHLQSHDIQSTVRAYLEDNTKTKEQADADIQKQAIVDRILRTLTHSPRFVSALKPHLRQDRRRYVHLRVLGGRAFLDNLHHQDEQPPEGHVYLSVSFGEQRFTSSRARCHVDPDLTGIFLLDLGLQLDDNLEQLLGVADKVHIVAIRSAAGGARAVIGSCTVDWRQVLVSENVHVSVELFNTCRQSPLPIGIVDLRLELLPKAEALLTDEALQRQVKAERVTETGALSRFISYAKEWRADFTNLRDSHRGRVVEVLACAENGDILPVSSFVQPLCGGRLIASPLEAARFVSLLGPETRGGADPEGLEVWSDTHTILAEGHRTVQERAVLLCNLLLGFGLDAYICLGKNGRGRHAWVATLSSNGDVTFWDSLTGRRYPQTDALAMGQCPYRSLGCIFNHERFFANNQLEDSARLASFDLRNGAHWISLDEDAIAAVKKAPRVGVQPASLVAHREEERLEGRLRTLVEGHRTAQKLGLTWDEGLSHLLMPALVSYENEHVLGVSVGLDEFQQSIKATVPTGHTFKAFPQHFAHRNAASVFESLLREPNVREILETKAADLKLALRVRMSVYPEDVCSTWIMLAATYRSKPRN